MAPDLLSLLLPARCAGCHALGPVWCEACWDGLERLRDPRCRRCGAPTRWPVAACRECRGRRLAFAWAWAAVAHRELGAVLVRRWKDRGLDLAPMAAAAVLAGCLAPAPDVVLCPVPAVGERRLRRGVDGPRALADRLGA